MAEPVASETATHDRDDTVRSPWFDDSPALVLDSHASDGRTTDHRLLSGIGVASLYAGFSLWAYVAWYRNHPEKAEHDFGRDGWFGVHTYAGGADKLGHAWATMTLARGGTAALRAGGWDRTKSALVSAALAEGLFFAVEMKDYYYYEFSPGDMTFNTIGALAAIAFDLSPRLDELFDYRVEYEMSPQYRHNLFDSTSPCAKRVPGQPSCSRWNIAEDYSGERYLVALHLGAIHPLRDVAYWTKFVDFSVGFQSRNYKPPATLDPTAPKRQTLLVGLSLNLQGLFDAALPRKSKLRKATHGLFEVATPPVTLGIGINRSTEQANSGGA